MHRTAGIVTMLLLSGALAAGAVVPARADSSAVVVFSAPTGSLAGPPTPLLPGGPPAVGTIRGTIGSGTTASTVPGVLLLTSQGRTRAYVVPVSTTAPSLPGVVSYGLQVVVPPIPVPGENRALALSALLKSALPPGTYIVLPVH